jgi:hypothetical protein
MATPDLRKDSDGTQAWRRLQDRHDLGVPYVGQRIGPPSPARGLLLRGQARISLDPVSRLLARNPPWRRIASPGLLPLREPGGGQDEAGEHG